MDIQFPIILNTTRALDLYIKVQGWFGGYSILGEGIINMIAVPVTDCCSFSPKETYRTWVWFINDSRRSSIDLNFLEAPKTNNIAWRRGNPFVWLFNLSIQPAHAKFNSLPIVPNSFKLSDRFPWLLHTGHPSGWLPICTKLLLQLLRKYLMSKPPTKMREPKPAGGTCVLHRVSHSLSDSVTFQHHSKCSWNNPCPAWQLPRAGSLESFVPRVGAHRQWLVPRSQDRMRSEQQYSHLRSRWFKWEWLRNN